MKHRLVPVRINAGTGGTDGEIRSVMVEDLGTLRAASSKWRGLREECVALRNLDLGRSGVFCWLHIFAG